MQCWETASRSLESRSFLVSARSLPYEDRSLEMEAEVELLLILQKVVAAAVARRLLHVREHLGLLGRPSA